MLHYQPKVEIASGRICGFEALLRWNHPHRGAAWKCFVSPTSGTLIALPALDAIRAQPGVHEVWLHREPGDTVADVDSNFSWIAQVMCTGQDQQEAKHNAARAVDFIAAQTTIA